VGTFKAKSGGNVVEPDHKKFLNPVLIPPGREQGAKNGDKVVAHIDEWSYQMLYGSVKKVLGRGDDPQVLGLQVVYAFNLPLDFPPVVEEEAAHAGQIPIDISDRRDLRQELVFTIDPDTAQDFDDALSIAGSGEKGFKLGVHIADVSHYVQAGTALDEEALARGNSVYLTDRVIPMLPEEDRLTLSVYMDIDEQGKVTGYEIAKTIINSSRRLTYKQAQDLLDGKPSGLKNTNKFTEALQVLKTLKDILYAKRVREGGLDLDVPEAVVQLDEQGRPRDIHIEPRLDSHRIVEECMLAANRTVAEYLKEQKVPFIYRIHEEPDAMALESYWSLMKLLGFFNRKGKNLQVSRLQSFLDGLPQHGHRMAHELLLRSMKKAVYAVRNKGHFGLGFKNYTHFTSPIRRYADLSVHRLLTQLLAGNEVEDKQELARHLDLVAKVTSEREQLGLEAERESLKVMQIQYLQNRLGDHFCGTISGVHRVGMFISLDDLLVEGLVPVGDMDDDYYVIDEEQQSLTGRRTKMKYQVGDRVKVQLVKADQERKEVDFQLIQKL
jgi:ribonuclease R